MTDVRQLPLFPSQPQSVCDLNRHTALRDTLPLFQAHLIREGKSDHTIKAFTSDLQLLADYTDERTPVGRFTTDRLNKFLDWLENDRGVPCSRKSYARRVTTLKVYFKWLYETGVIGHDPAKAVLQRSGPAPLAIILTPDEIDRAITIARSMRRTARGSDTLGELDTRPEMLFRLILDTGIKKSELMELTPTGIHRLPPTLTIKHKKARDIYKERTIALDNEWLRLFDRYMAQYRPGEPIINCTARNLEYILTDIGLAAGIPNKISFEMLRWTCAVCDFRAGVEPDFIRDKLGLSPISWQETFTKIKKLTEKLEANI